ncbi:hypothetical protein HHI36_021377 [Cryptolaemus montrouzieri]|uniref:CRAL-TRIO domain-containing protein n=1 Tax=Cryptolaemus montrouzieri TaxID=559131 RepID=A0ABD2MXX7_9CUCU
MSLPKFGFSARDIIQDKRVSQDEITEIRLWMLSVNLPVVSEETIVIYIVACKRDLDLTRRAIMAYYLCARKCPEIFDDRDVEQKDLRQAMDTVYHASIPVMTDDNCVVHIFKLNDTKYYNFHIDPVAKLCFMLPLISVNRKSLPNGLKVVIDAKGAGLFHLTRFKLKTMKMMIEYLQEGLPLHVKEIHVLNTMMMVDKLIFILKPFMKPELYNILHLHPNNTDLEEFSKNYIPKKCLPSDYGGDLCSFKELNEKTREQYGELREFFETEENIRREWAEHFAE